MTAAALASDDTPDIECPYTDALLHALIPWGRCGTSVSRGEADPKDLARRMDTLYPLAIAVCAYRRDVLTRACRGVDYAVRTIAHDRLARFVGWPTEEARDLFSKPITADSAPWVGLAALALYESWPKHSHRSEGALAILFDAGIVLGWLSAAIYGEDDRALELAGRCSAGFAITEGATILVGTWEPAERLVRITLGLDAGGRDRGR